MPDPTHLDELMAASAQPLSRKLLETFRAVARDPAFTAADYATRLKSVMEESLQEASGHAASDSQDT